jgi:DNA polymerase-3 subunit chi
MPKVDFYILPDASSANRLTFACRLIEKAYKNRHRIYIHTSDKKEAYELDELLWTYREESFLPHHLYGEGPEPAPPIQIGFNIIPDKHRDILMNLSEMIPSFYSQFTRVFELIPNESHAQSAARERYRDYRTAGCDMTTHKLETVE